MDQLYNATRNGRTQEVVNRFVGWQPAQAGDDEDDDYGVWPRRRVVEVWGHDAEMGSPYGACAEEVEIDGECTIAI